MSRIARYTVLRLWQGSLSMLLLILWGGSAVYAQGNLLANPGFESFTSCPSWISQLDSAAPWSRPVGHTGTSDFYHACNGAAAGVPNNVFGTEPAHGGQGYIGIYLYAQGINYREYASSPLLTPLVSGQRYFISAWVSLADISYYGTNALQFYFSQGPAIHVNNNLPMTQLTPQAVISAMPFITNQAGWVQVSASFVAAGGEDYVCVGNFLDDLNTPLVTIPGMPPQHAYVYMDDFFIALNNMPDTTICEGACADLWARGDSGTTTVWTTTSSTVPIGTGNTISVCPTSTTDYIATFGMMADTIRVNVISAPINVHVGVDTTICTGDSLLLGPGIAHHPTFSYNWYPTGDTTATIVVDSAATYQVVVSNVCGADSADLTLTLLPTPEPQLGNDTAVCFGQSILLDPMAGPGQYVWSTSATSSTLNATTTGSYAVTVSNAVGCAQTDTLNLFVAQPIQVNATATDITCFGAANGTASAQPTGSGPFTYQWSVPGASSTASLSGLLSGTYVVTVTDSIGCTQSAQVAIGEPGPMSLTTTSTDETCAQRADGLATGVVSGGVAPYVFQWSNGDQQATADSLSPGSYSVTVTDVRGCTVPGNVIIGTREVVVNTAGMPAFCEGEGGDTLFASAAGGDGPYTYTWWCDSLTIGNCGLDSIFDDDPVANPGSSDWYYVQATDVTGCPSEVDSLFIDVLPKPIVDAGPDVYICGDSAPCVVLTPSISGAPGPYTYQWLPTAGLSDPTIANPCARPDSTTIYTLLVTGGNGCSSDFTTTDTLSTVIVHVSPRPIADAGPDLHLCAGDTATLLGLGTGAGPNYTYQWSPTSGLLRDTVANPQVAPALTTTYTFMVESNFCPSYGDQVTVFVHTLPTVDAGPNRESCLGEDILLDAQAGGDSTATYSFVWHPAASLNDPFLEDPIARPPSTTWYSVQASSNWGCKSNRDSVLVTLLPTPIAEAGNDLTTCRGNVVQLQGSYYYTTTDSADVAGIYYSWNPGAMLDDATLAQPLAQPDQSGWYTFQVRTGTCQTSDSVFVTVFPELGLRVSSDTSTVCEGDSVALSAVAGLGGADFQWFPGTGLSQTVGATTMAAPAQSTVYQVVAQEGTCTDTAEIFLEILPLPEAAYFSSQRRGCAPLTVSFMQNSSDGTFFIWDFGDGSPVSNAQFPTHTYSEPGIYPVSLQVVVRGGCASKVEDLQVEVVKDVQAAFTTLPEIPSQIYLPNGEVQFFNHSVNASGYVWKFGDGTQSSELNPVHQFAAPGAYTVTLLAMNPEGCQHETALGPFLVKSPDLFIPNVFSPNDDGVNDFFRIDYSGNQPFYLEIYDRWGAVVYASNNKIQGWNGRAEGGEQVPEGVFFYRLQVGSREYAGEMTLVR